MVRPLTVGDMIHGHVAGYFGRDYYDCARVEALGSDWVVVRTERAMAVTLGLTSNPDALFRALLEARDNPESWLCEHQRPESGEM